MESILRILRLGREFVKSGILTDLLIARRHGAYLSRHRLEAIIIRVRLVALAFAILTIVWIPFDIIALDEGQWSVLLGVRLIVALLFLSLAGLPECQANRRNALAMMGVMITAPLFIFLASQVLGVGAGSNILGVINGRLYESLPVVILAGLCIFPLVVVEGLFFGAAIAVVVTLTQWFWLGEKASDLITNLWVLSLGFGVYLLASGIQLHYMMALLRKASYDPMTGALTRRSGVEILDLHFGVSRDRDKPLSLLFLDADNFKSINDIYGHEAGDQALKAIVAALHKYLRQADLVIRWGGEEFVVVLTDTPVEGAEIVIRRMLEYWFGSRPDGKPLTASIGLAERQADKVLDWAELIALADERMYQAKKGGRARCVGGHGVIA